MPAGTEGHCSDDGSLGFYCCCMNPPMPPSAPPSAPATPSPPRPPPYPPSPPPPAYPIGLTTTAETLNARFRRTPYEPTVWRHTYWDSRGGGASVDAPREAATTAARRADPGGRLADAAVLVHLFDGWENNDHQKLWELRGDQSASMIHKGQGFPGGIIPIFNGGGSGLVFRPLHTILKCGKGGDSGGHCSDRFCPSTSRLGSGNWGYPGDGCGGTWRVSDFGIFLRRQARWQVQNRRLQYNEIIINGDATRANMPAALDAFFYTGSDSGQARSQRALFLREFGDEVAGGIPLVRLDTSNWHMPFSRGH